MMPWTLSWHLLFRSVRFLVHLLRWRFPPVDRTQPSSTIAPSQFTQNHGVNRRRGLEFNEVDRQPPRLGYAQRSAIDERASVTEAYLIKPAVAAPIVATAILVLLAFTGSIWWLIGVPFAIIGTICGQPNLNLADGCLAWMMAGLGLLVAAFHRDIGVVIATSSVCGLLLGAFEKTLRAVPYDDGMLQSSKHVDESQDECVPDENEGRTM